MRRTVIAKSAVDEERLRLWYKDGFILFSDFFYK